MISSYYLPQKISDKFLARFLKDTTRVGELIDIEGFIIQVPFENEWRKALWPKLSPIAGNFEVRGITPFPEDNFPVLPIIIPAWAKKNVRTGRVEGRVYDLSMFSAGHGRFLIVDKIERVPYKKYITLESSGLHGSVIRDIINQTFPELAAEVFAVYFMSSPSYIGRTGGSAVSILDANSKYYAYNMNAFGEIFSMLKPALRNSKYKLSLSYDGNIETTISLDFKIRYDNLKKAQARKYYRARNSKLWEKSAMTVASVKAQELIQYADVPYLPKKEETVIIDDTYLKDYSLDIGFYVLEKHIQEPAIDEKFVEGFKAQLVRKLEREFPMLVEAMKLGILMDIADVNGFGEHAARVAEAYKRLGADNLVDSAANIYLALFERMEDIMQERIKNELNAAKEHGREKRIINRVLWELNLLKPTGWDYEYFATKLEERGYTKDPEKLLTKLHTEGHIIMKRKGIYYAISNL